ncbi:MAG: chloride channel protein [Verrucomicrobiota bacterium]
MGQQHPEISDADEELEVLLQPGTSLREKELFVSKLRRQLDYSVFALSIFAVIIGLLAAYGSAGFRLAFGTIQTWIQNASWTVGYSFLAGPLGKMVLLAAGGLIFGIILAALRWERFRTPAHVIVAAQEGGGRLRWWDGLVTAGADALSLGLGASVGRYGPAIQLGATVGSAVGQWLKLGRTSIRILLGCGVAASISAAFNAPIAGVIFAHEVIIGHFRFRAFVPVTLSSVAAVAITRAHHFEYVAMKLFDAQQTLSLVDYPIYIGIGLGGAAIALAYMHGITNLGWLARKAYLPIWLQPMIGGVIAGSVAFLIPEVLGLGDEIIQNILEQDIDRPRYGAWMLLALIGAKLIASIACLGLRFPGGAFTPAIFVGAAYGGLLGLLIPGIDYQIAVLVGMGALMSSVVGAPLAMVLVVFELTENYQATTAVMVGVVAANAVVTRLFGRSLFHRQIRRWGIDLDRPQEQRRLSQMPVTELMGSSYHFVRPHRTVAEIRKIISRSYRGEVYIVDETQRLLGVISMSLLAKADPDEQAHDICSPITASLLQTDSVWKGFNQIDGMTGETVPVIDNPEDRQLIGVIHLTEFVGAYRKAVREVRED